MLKNLNIRKNVVTSIFAFSINIVLTFIGYRLIIENEGLEILGLWSLLSASIFIMRLGDIGLGGAAERYIAVLPVESEAEKIKVYFDTALIINTLIFTCLSIVGWCLFSSNINWIIPGNVALQKQALELLPIMFVIFLTSNLAIVFSGGLKGLHLGYQVGYLSIIANIVQMLLIILLVPIKGLFGLAIAQLVQYLFIIICSWFLIFSHVNKFKKLNWFLFRIRKYAFNELFKFSIKAQSVTLINGLFEPVSKFIVGHTAGFSVLGVYELAYKIVSLPRNAVVSGVLSLTPAIARLLEEDRKEAKNLYFKSKKMVVSATCAILMLVIACSPVISWMFFEEINWSLVIFIGFISLGFIGNVIGAPAYILGYSSGKLKGNMISSIASIFLLILISFILDYFSFDYAGLAGCTLGLISGGLIVMKINQSLLEV